MNRIFLFLFVTTLAFAAPTIADEKEQAASVNKLAEKLIKATVDGNYELVVELTYEKAVEALGGKKKHLRQSNLKWSC